MKYKPAKSQRSGVIRCVLCRYTWPLTRTWKSMANMMRCVPQDTSEAWPGTWSVLVGLTGSLWTCWRGSCEFCFVFKAFCFILEWTLTLHQQLYLLAEATVIWAPPVCVCISRLQDAISLVSLFHMVHPHSESAQEAASQQATGTDLLKVTPQCQSRSADLKLCLTLRYI